MISLGVFEKAEKTVTISFGSSTKSSSNAFQTDHQLGYISTQFRKFCQSLGLSLFHFIVRVNLLQEINACLCVCLFLQGVPLATEPGISLIILPLMRILLLRVATIRRTTDTFLFISHTTNVLLFKFRCNIFMPGSVASGTTCIRRFLLNFRKLYEDLS